MKQIKSKNHYIYILFEIPQSLFFSCLFLPFFLFFRQNFVFYISFVLLFSF